jgi:hypothetical protein
MIRLAAECQKVPPEPISDVQHLKTVSGRHISRVSTHIHVLIFPSDRYQNCRIEMYSV